MVQGKLVSKNARELVNVRETHRPESKFGGGFECVLLNNT